MCSPSTKPELVIAGPGSGKTLGMVREIVRVLPSLKPNRILAAITYTNAAADSIRECLQGEVALGPNVFVGTNHSFLNRFIVRPYAWLFGYARQDHICCDLDLSTALGKKPSAEQRAKGRRAIIGEMSKHGVIAFDHILTLSRRLMKIKRVRSVVGNRIQYLFIDEFQDADTQQFQVFDELRKAKTTKIYAVGDPEQYICGYAYSTTGRRAPAFERIPLNRFREVARVREETHNWRSVAQIVSFTNRFHTEIRQTSKRETSERGGVFFIQDTAMGTIVNRYREVVGTAGDPARGVTKYFLAYENRTFEGCAAKYGLVPVTNQSEKGRGLLDASVDLITSVTQMSRGQVCENLRIERLEYRKVAMGLLRAVANRHIADTSAAVSFVEAAFGRKFRRQYRANLKQQFERLREALSTSEAPRPLERHSSVHKAKGLEADAVLALAKTAKELRDWLKTDKAARRSEKTDRCRIGFVAFSRAKDVLCLACLEAIDGQLRRRLLDLGVALV